jgi:hypothetical protein
MQQIQLIQLHGVHQQGMLEKFPDTCPICHRSIVPEIFGGSGNWNDQDKTAQVVFRCVATLCQNLFIGTYTIRQVAAPGMVRTSCALVSVEPMRPAQAAVPDSVSKISPTFVVIRNQVADAEARGLDQIVGIGLRKALEFLIKDFAISRFPNDAAKIKKMFLSHCIDEYIKDGNVSACAKRAAWLGNDEAHYLRKWDAKDVGDLKRLIHLTVNWIDSLHETEGFVGDMPAP